MPMVGSVNIPDAGIEKPDSGIPQWQNGLIAVKRAYWVPNSAIATFLAALNGGDADAVYTDAKLSGVTVSYESPSVRSVEVMYTPTNWSFEFLPAVGTITQEASANPMEVPIGKGPKAISVGDKEALIKDGVEALLVPMPTYKRTEIKSSFTWTEANIISNVAKIDTTPEGMTSPTAEKWLMMDHTVQEQGGAVTESMQWQYNPTGWDTDLYDTVA